MGALISSVLSILRAPSEPLLRTAVSGIQLPRTVHMVLSESEVNKYRQTFIIGDIHGCGHELVRLLDEAKARDDETLKIFAGDMVNKGPDSPGVLKLIRSMPHFAVRGNNEESVLRECRAKAANPDYQLPIKYKWVEKLDESDIKYLDELPYTIFIPSLNSIIVHAGLVPGKPLTAQQPIDMVTMRNVIVGEYYDDEGIRAVSETDQGKPWATLWAGPQHVYFGHDAMRSLQRHEFATGLDTGCVYGGQLTGIFVNGERKGETVSVTSKLDYKKLQKQENEAHSQTRENS